MHPTVEVRQDASIYTTVIASDYSFFQRIYEAQNNPALCNDDLTGSQYIHEYVGSPLPQTFYRSELRNCKNASQMAGVFCSIFGFHTATAILGLATLVYDNMLDIGGSQFYKVVISSDTYQVLFAVDRSYYIHCYHQKAEFFEENATRPYKTERDYYQAIGG